MNEIKRIDLPEVRTDFVPTADYTSPEVTKLEFDRLWTRVWQVACREEDIPLPGNYETYKVADQSIFVVRTTKGEIKAFHNACPHRGRELTAGCGSITKVHCPFHGWQWNLDGEITRVTNREDWDGFSNMDDASLHLAEVKVSSWGGWVFINMAEDPEPFESFIDPLPKYLDCVEFDKMRYAWRKSWVMKANWKIAIEAFMESYHVETLHPQAAPLIDPSNFSSAHGKHGRHAYYWERPLGTPAKSTGLPMPDDIRPGIAAAGIFNGDQLGGVTGAGARDGQLTERSALALQRHLTDTPDGLPILDTLMLSVKYMKEAAEAEGAGWPTVTPEQAAEIGADWSIFPNIALVHSLDGTLVFWARPNGRDPESCLFQMAALGRYAPGKEPKPEREFYDDWQANLPTIPYLLAQDLSNIESIQRGLHSIGLKGTRINPKQETQISHFHEVLHSYLAG